MWKDIHFAKNKFGGLTLPNVKTSHKVKAIGTCGTHDGRTETEKWNRVESRERTIQYGQIIDKDANATE